MNAPLAAVKLAFKFANPRPAIVIRFDPKSVDVGGKYNERYGGWMHPITAVIQPFGANTTAENRLDLQKSLAGERVEKFFTIWTETPLRTTDEDLGTQADWLLINERQTLKIVSVSERHEADFTRAIGGLMSDRGRSL